MSNRNGDWIGWLAESARTIFSAAVAGVAPERLVAAAIDRHELVREAAGANGLGVLACGKASIRMAQSFLQQVQCDVGHVTAPHGALQSLPHPMEVTTSSHPVPDAASVVAAENAMRLAESSHEGDLIVVLLSGGGSSLWAGVPTDLTLDDKQRTIRALLRSGAPIRELNAVRKHVSSIKGGQLARAISPARSVSLMISDVVGDTPSVIASGPTVGDDTTFDEALEVLENRGGLDYYPKAVTSRLRRGARGLVAETPGRSDPIFASSRHYVIGSNRDAMAAAADAASRLGFEVRTSAEPVVGEAADAGRRLVAEMITGVDAPTCYIWGGETTVSVTGPGKGGRNQELALSAAVALQDSGARAVFLSGGTDGVDGPTDAAGAVVSPFSVADGERAGRDARAFLRDNNSYEFFAGTVGHLITGPTGTNVMDVQVGLVLPADD